MCACVFNDAHSREQNGLRTVTPSKYRGRVRRYYVHTYVSALIYANLRAMSQARNRLRSTLTFIRFALPSAPVGYPSAEPTMVSTRRIWEARVTKIRGRARRLDSTTKINRRISSRDHTCDATRRVGVGLDKVGPRIRRRMYFIFVSFVRRVRSLLATARARGFPATRVSVRSCSLVKLRARVYERSHPALARKFR